MQEFDFETLQTADLVVDAIYKGGRSGNAGDDPLPRLVSVSNQGGFRIRGTKTAPNLIVLTSSFTDPNWPDHLDQETGIFTYFGDNQEPGRRLHNTRRWGNTLLRDTFEWAHANPTERRKVPPFLVFRKAGVYRDMVFLGLAVPGAQELRPTEDLVAIWKTSGEQRFQNYRATFTIIDVASVSRAWLDDIKAGNTLSHNCPAPWRQWIERGTYRPLRAERTLEYRTKDQQLPDNDRDMDIVRTIHDYFSDSFVDFEHCAAELAQMMDTNVASIDVTRPSRDGGRDAIGTYRVGHGGSAITVDFALEAKCFGVGNSVGVKEVSRLISRLRHRQFGILVTTSYVNTTAYKEIKEDQHPVVIVAARDIVEILSRADINTPAETLSWLEARFPRD